MARGKIHQEQKSVPQRNSDRSETLLLVQTFRMQMDFHPQVQLLRAKITALQTQLPQPLSSPKKFLEQDVPVSISPILPAEPSKQRSSSVVS